MRLRECQFSLKRLLKFMTICYENRAEHKVMRHLLIDDILPKKDMGNRLASA